MEELTYIKREISKTKKELKEALKLNSNAKIQELSNKLDRLEVLKYELIKNKNK